MATQQPPADGLAPTRAPRTASVPPAAPTPGGAAAAVGRYRWTICALLFFATTINYIDRQVLGILAPTLQTEIGWNEAEYGAIVSWFTFAYALGFLTIGRLMDRIGTRKGFSVAIVIWSAAAMAHALARTATGFSVARFALGLGESGNFPGAIKTVAEWFPKKERAFATGIFNAGSNVGAIITPLIVPWIALTWGWQWAFIITGAFGFIWLALWLTIYRKPEEHPKLSAGELAYIRSDAAEPTTPIPWGTLLGYKQTWAFALGKLLTDPVWWFYLFWLPKFLDARFGIKLAGLAAPLIAIYLFADVGSVAGGWVSGAFLKRGWSANRARKTTMGIAAAAIVPTMLAPQVSSMWLAVAIVSVAAAAHQWWSANLFTLTTDLFPRRAVASIVGIGGCAGALGGFAFQRATGAYLQTHAGDYGPVFVVCGLAYVVGLLVIHVIVPRLEPAPIDGAVARG